MAEYDAQPGRPTPPDPGLSPAQLEADELDLHAGLEGVARIVAGGRGVAELLGDVAEFAVHAIPGVDYVGVTAIDRCGHPPYVQAWAATADFVETIDTIQYDELKEGPSITCMESRRPTVSGSLGSDSRWPHFGGRVARLGVHSVLSLPLIVDNKVVGAINAYARGRDAFAEHAVKLGSQFAGPVAVSVYNAQLLARARERAEQLQRALGSRPMIDQAIGILRSRAGVSQEEAFERLTRISQKENIKLYRVAEQIVDEAVRRARVQHHGP